MEKTLKKKISALDPKFKSEMNTLFSHMNECLNVLYEAATKDEKTGLYNHKFFETILDMEIEKVKRGKQKLSMILMDIDFFKKINDSYGHIKADDLLEQLAKVTLKTIRKSDIAARFGGEEFVILLPETPLEKAKKFSNRLKKSIHEDKILKKYSLTVSGGVTEFRKKDSEKQFKIRADKALYQAKKTGRDRFVFI